MLAIQRKYSRISKGGNGDCVSVFWYDKLMMLVLICLVYFGVVGVKGVVGPTYSVPGEVHVKFVTKIPYHVTA